MITWGGWSIEKADWEFIYQVIQENHVKTVLEFGAGLSTLMFMSAGCQVVSMESNQATIESFPNAMTSAFKPLDDGIRGCLLRGDSLISIEVVCRSFLNSHKFDLAFVDGPQGVENRRNSFILAMFYSDLIIVHDWPKLRDETSWYSDKFIGNHHFELINTGGHVDGENWTAIFKKGKVVKSLPGKESII